MVEYNDCRDDSERDNDRRDENERESESRGDRGSDNNSGNEGNEVKLTHTVIDYNVKEASSSRGSSPDLRGAMISDDPVVADPVRIIFK